MALPGAPGHAIIPYYFVSSAHHKKVRFNKKKIIFYFIFQYFSPNVENLRKKVFSNKKFFFWKHNGTQRMSGKMESQNSYSSFKSESEVSHSVTTTTAYPETTYTRQVLPKILANLCTRKYYKNCFEVQKISKKPNLYSRPNFSRGWNFSTDRNCSKNFLETGNFFMDSIFTNQENRLHNSSVRSRNFPRGQNFPKSENFPQRFQGLQSTIHKSLLDSCGEKSEVMWKGQIPIRPNSFFYILFL